MTPRRQANCITFHYRPKKRKERKKGQETVVMMRLQIFYVRNSSSSSSSGGKNEKKSFFFSRSRFCFQNFCLLIVRVQFLRCPPSPSLLATMTPLLHCFRSKSQLNTQIMNVIRFNDKVGITRVVAIWKSLFCTLQCLYLCTFITYTFVPIYLYMYLYTFVPISLILTPSTIQNITKTISY